MSENVHACDRGRPPALVRILLTGGASFIGSHVAERLEEECANVRFIEDDVRSFDLLSYVLQSERIDAVMHFAVESRGQLVRELV